MEVKWSYVESHFSRLLLFLVLNFTIQESLAITTDGLALLEFRARIDSDPFGAFANWDSNDTTPCIWFGVHCVDSKVQMLNLSTLALKGTLAPELAKLSNLRSLVLYKNHFSGVIPKEFGELTKLKLLDLRENNLSGMIPAEIGKMSSLNCLLLYDNKFEGSYPSDRGRLKLHSKQQFDENLASISTTRICCANRKFGLCIWQKIWRQLNRAGSLFIPIKGALSYLNVLRIQWFKLQKDTLAENNDNFCRDVHGSCERQMAHNVRNLVVTFKRRKLLEESRNLPAAPATDVPSTEQIIALPSTRSSGSFPAVPKGTGSNSRPADQSSQTNSKPADQSSQTNSKPSDQSSQTNLKPADQSSQTNSKPADQSSQTNSKPADKSSQTSKPTSQNPSTLGNTWKYFFIILCVVVFLVIVVLAIMWRKREANTVCPWKTGLSGQLQKAFVTGVPRLYRSELDIACEDFSNIVQILDGCTMYKGILSSGVEIAVASVCVSSLKQWSKNLESTFRRKIDRLSRVNHKNFVNLIGYCEEDVPFSRMMVFEYAPNGSLFDHLHDKEMEHLDWGARVRIIMGVAYCLLHLHHEQSPPLSLPKLTSRVVFLTEDYAAKITEGLGFEALTQVKKSGDDLSEHSVLAPLVDQDVNVYSFGILLLETISAKLVYSQELGPIEDWAGQYLNDKWSLSNLVDPTLESFKHEELEVMCEVIQECIQTDPNQRPTMKDVCSKLRQATKISPQEACPRVSPLWWAELELLSMKEESS